MARQIAALWRLSILLTMAIPAAAQTQTPQAVLATAVKAMGTDTVKCLTDSCAVPSS
jgi:hypothetical protein